MSLAGAQEDGNQGEGSTDLAGQELIDALGLPQVDGHDASCYAKFDYGGILYCLDPSAGSEAEAVALANRIRGEAPPTPEEAALHQAQADLVEAHAAVEDAAAAQDEEALETATADVVRLSTKVVDLQAAIASEGS
jgi:hypothetical protein